MWTYPYKRSDPLQQFTSICSKWQFPIFVYRLISNNVIKLYDSSFCLKLEFINFPSNWKRNSFYCNLFRSGYRWGIQFIKNARWHRTSSYMAASSWCQRGCQEDVKSNPGGNAHICRRFVSKYLYRKKDEWSIKGHNSAKFQSNPHSNLICIL